MKKISHWILILIISVQFAEIVTLKYPCSEKVVKKELEGLPCTIKEVTT